MHDVKAFISSRTGSATSGYAAAVLFIAGLSLLGVRVLSVWADGQSGIQVAATPSRQGVDRTPTGSIIASTATPVILDPCTGLRK